MPMVGSWWSFFSYCPAFWCFTHTHAELLVKKGGAEFLYDRFARLYPTYFTTLLYCAGLVVISRLFDLNVYFAASTITNFVLGLFMVHYIGFTPPEYSFDFPAWFLSALLLCYISSIWLRKRDNQRSTDTRHMYYAYVWFNVFPHLSDFSPDLLPNHKHWCWPWDD